MGDSHIKRSMDEFLINPTAPMEDYRRFQEPSSPTSSIAHPNPTDIHYASKSRYKPVEESATIRRFDEDLNAAAFWRGYTSDEEIASPVDKDDFTFDPISDDESIASIQEAQFHAQTCNNAQQLCNRAQAVQLVSAGKPKVVSMPGPTEIPTTYSPEASDYETEVRPSVLSISRMRGTGNHHPNDSTISYSPRSSGDDSYSSVPIPPASQPTGPNLVRRKPHLPRLQMPTRSDSPQSYGSGSTPRTAWPARRPDFLDYDPFGSDYSIHATPSPSTPKRKLRRLSPPFSLKSLTRSLKRSSTTHSSFGDGGISKKDISRPIISPIVPDVYVPTRASSMAIPKMVARGANERAAAIEIPPCPEDYDDDFDVPVWPQRNDSVAHFYAPRPVTNKVHEHRKSLSAFVSTPA